MVIDLDATLPSDTASMVSDLGGLIREERTTINEIIAAIGSIITFTSVDLVAGSNTLVVGTDVSSSSWEVLSITGAAGAVFTNITGASEGQMKVFIFGDDDCTITDDNAAFRLNSTPYPTNFAAKSGDVIAFVNIGGDPGTSTNGYWKEVYRTLAV